LSDVTALECRSNSALVTQAKFTSVVAEEAAVPRSGWTRTPTSAVPRRGLAAYSRALSCPAAEHVSFVSGTTHRLKESWRKRTGSVREHRPPADACGTPSRPAVAVSGRAERKPPCRSLVSTGSPYLYRAASDGRSVTSTRLL